MAQHQQSSHDRGFAAQGMSSSNGLYGYVNLSTSGDDESISDDDDPPKFSKVVAPNLPGLSFEHRYMASAHLQRSRKESLLTQALLTSPELTPMSDAEAPVLTSDGGMTSPTRTTTPSPPLSVLNNGGFTSLISSDITTPAEKLRGDDIQVSEAKGSDRSQELKVEEGLGRRRCIRFACGRLTNPPKQNDPPEDSLMNTDVSLKPVGTSKRPCMLKFACPMKPSHPDHSTSETSGKSIHKSMFSKAESVVPISDVSLKERCCPVSTAKSSPVQHTFISPVTAPSRRVQVFNRIDFQKSEATRFNEFAGPFNAEDEWINEQTAYRQKITIDDTLRKENVIRKLAEEAEEEALDEDADEGIEGYENSHRFVDDFDDDDIFQSDEASDGGNETDDEEGFADSDGESDGNSDYQFWTPGFTTAATSTGYLEHILLAAHKTVSESSIEFTNDAKNGPTRPRKQPTTHTSPRMRPGTPELPDDAEFVIGTLDEDKPLEDAYMSWLEERRRSRNRHIPQDIDPSFPTSEPDADNIDDEEEDATQVRDEPECVLGRPDSSSEERSNARKHSSLSTKTMKSPTPSPKRIHSPPLKRAILHRSPPPRRLFGQSIHRLRSPPPIHRKLTSPPSSRRPSVSGSPCGINMPHLAQRPNLTHTTSLPRTPNPFWDQHRMSRFHGSDSPLVGISPKTTDPALANLHSRGPIDIVQGLETKRQRRKDKFWRQHCRNAGKERERRCQPGKGAERMKELGLEIADRCKGYGQKPQLVVSV